MATTVPRTHHIWARISPVGQRRNVMLAGAVSLTTGAMLCSLLVAPGVSASPNPAVPSVSRVSTARNAASTSAAHTRAAALLPTRVKSPYLGTSFSMRSVDVVTRLKIYSKKSLVPRLPASTMKLVTAVTALAVLGPTKKFPTRVVTGKSPTDAIIVAGGDPLLSSLNLRNLATSAATVWSTQLAVAYPLPGPTPTPSPSPSPTPPVPPVTPTPKPRVALTLHADDSLFAVPTAAPGWTSDYVPYVVAPVRPFLRDLRHSSSSTYDVGSYFTSNLQSAMRAVRPDLAITVTWSGRAKAATTATNIATYGGHSVHSALSYMLSVSENDIAEMLFRLSALGAHRPATWAGGAATARDTMNRLGVRTTEFVFADGSGVSRRDRVTAYGLVQLLRAAALPAHASLNQLRSMLPVAGRTGTLRARYGRFTAKPSRCAAGIVQAKTGTLHDVVGLAGYTRGADGRLKAFAILVNNRPERFAKLATRRAVDNLAATITGCY